MKHQSRSAAANPTTSASKRFWWGDIPEPTPGAGPPALYRVPPGRGRRSGSAAVAGGAALVERTDVPAGAAVARIGLLVDAGVAADRLVVGADAPGTRAGLAGTTHLAASAAVIRIAPLVDARAGAG